MTKLKKIHICLALLGASGIANSALTQPLTNLEILRQLLVTPVLQALDSVQTTSTAIRIEAKDQNAENQWLVNQVRREVLEENIGLYDQRPDTTEIDLIVIVEDWESGISYRGVSRNFLLQYRQYSRDFRTSLSFYIKKKDESIIYVHSKSDNYQDLISRGDIQLIENSLYMFSRGNMVESTFMKKIMEPALLTVATIGVIYLFFSLRSSR